MFKYLFLGFFLLFFTGCGSFYENMESSCSTKVISGTRENGIIQKIYKDGWLYVEGKVGNNGRDGWWTYYRKDGTIFTKKLFKDGEWNGEMIVFYENGQVAWKGMSEIINPSSNIKTEYFTPNGIPISEKEYSEKYNKLAVKWLDELWKEKYGSSPNN